MAEQTRAEEVFKKSREEMSDTELMMADIMSKGSETPAENSAKQESSAPQAPVPPPKKARRRVPKDSFLASGPSIPQPAAPAAEEEDDDVIAYVPKTKPKEATAASPAASSDSKRKKTKRKRKSAGPRGVIIALCLLGIAGVVIFNYSLKNLFVQQEETIDNPSVSFPPDMVFPSPEAGESEGSVDPSAESAVVILSGTPEETPTPEETLSPEPTPSEEPGTKRFFKADVSWTDAQADCAAMGGHLVTIADTEELQEVIALAEEAGVDKVWIGCHRENGELVWENGEMIDINSLNAWDSHEPSYYDSGDNVYEDYLLLWQRDGRWCFNDSRNDPVADYPYMYSGMIGYVCEFD